MKQKDDLTIKKMKQIAHEVIESEAKKENINLNLFPVTIIEYYKKLYANNPIYKLINPSQELLTKATIPLTTNGVYFYSNDICVFMHYSKKLQNVENRLFYLLKTCYHEFRHAMQHNNFNEASYEKTIINLEDYLRTMTSDGSYFLQHDQYFLEADANIYGVRKAKEYLKDKYPDIYEKDKELIERLERKYYLDYISVDASDIVERVIKSARTENRIEKQDAKRYNRKIDKERLITPNKISPVLTIFLNEDLSFKKISEITSHKYYNKVDPRTTAAILSSKSFLKETNIKELSEEELETLISSLYYTNTIYQNQSKILEKHQNFDKCSVEELKKRKGFYEKLIYFDDQLKKILLTTARPITDFLELTRDEGSKIDHKETVPYYMQEVERTSKKK